MKATVLISAMNHNQPPPTMKVYWPQKPQDHRFAFIQVIISKSLSLPTKLCFLIPPLLFCKMTFKYDQL